MDEKRFHTNLERWGKTCPKQAVMLPYIDSSYLYPTLTKKGEHNLEKAVNGKKIALHSCEDAMKEANCWFSSLPLEKIMLVCVYGVGLGYYYLAINSWLKKSPKRRVVFLEDDLGVIQHLLDSEQGEKLLADSQVQLLYFNDFKKDTAIFEGLYWNFSRTKLLISSLKSYSEIKAPILDQLRHRIAYDAAMKNALVDEYIRFGASYYVNFYQNILTIERTSKKDISSLPLYFGNYFFGKFHKVPAIICGAGPSLQKHLSLLKGLMDKAIVFAGGSALNALNSADFQPHFGAGIDPNPAQYTRMSQNQAYEVPFFYRNRMYNKAFKLIHGPRLYITGAGGYATAEYFEKEVGIPREREEIDEGHNVVNFCVEIAHAMGCDPIIFVGMDLAFTGMHEYAPGVVENPLVNQSEILNIEDEDSRAVLKKDIYGNPTYTLWKWIAEADWIGDFAKNHTLVTFINCTEGGLGFPGVANIPLSTIANERLNRSFEMCQRIHGEIQNSALLAVTKNKVLKAMNLLSLSLKKSVDYLKLLIEDAKENQKKIKEGKEPFQSGKAALAESDLYEEVGYRYVLEVFNELFAHLLSGDIHRLSVKKLSKKQRELKRLSFLRRKFNFLCNVALVNEGLITYALKEKNKKKSSRAKSLCNPSILFDRGKYLFSDKKILIEDKELELFFKEDFDPILIPKEKKEGIKLEKGGVLRVFFDDRWKLYECYSEKDGVQDGQAYVFYPDGSIKTESFYAKGKLHGPSRFWTNDGKLLAESFFIKGLQEGKSLWHYSSGALYSLQRFKRGEWDGKQEFYYENGQIKTLMEYKEGKLVGQVTALLPDGTVARLNNI